MKIKCHLHSVEANVRSIELALADVMVSHDLQKGFAMCTHALVLAKKYLKELYNGSGRGSDA